MRMQKSYALLIKKICMFNNEHVRFPQIPRKTEKRFISVLELNHSLSWLYRRYQRV